MEIIRKETTYRNRNAVQTYPATSLAFAGSRRHKSRPSMNIVTHAYRPKRKRKAQGATIAGPVIVTAKSKRTPRQAANVVAADEPTKAGDCHRSEPSRSRFADVPDTTPEEH
jgi:hypothetical protein